MLSLPREFRTTWDRTWIRIIQHMNACGVDVELGVTLRRSSKITWYHGIVSLDRSTLVQRERRGRDIVSDHFVVEVMSPKVRMYPHRADPAIGRAVVSLPGHVLALPCIDDNSLRANGFI